jgi:thioredoxin 2
MPQTILHTCSRCGAQNRVPLNRLGQQGRCGVCKTPLAPLAEPLEVGPAEFDEIIASSPVPVLVDFWAPWCGPCRMAAPEVEALAREMAGRALVLKVNTEEHPELAARFRIHAIPTFAVFQGGRLVMQRSGYMPRHQLAAWLTAAAPAA